MIGGIAIDTCKNWHREKIVYPRYAAIKDHFVHV